LLRAEVEIILFIQSFLKSKVPLDIVLGVGVGGGGGGGAVRGGGGGGGGGGGCLIWPYR